jgi:2'-5' RNA ligase
MDGLHLTLRFLGPTLDERMPALVDAIQGAVAGVTPFRVRLAGGGAFPGPDRPRVLWLGVAEGVDRLGDLARSLEDRLVSAGWLRDERPFRAHLTLARSDGVAAGPATARALVAAAEAFRAEWTADRLMLFESHTGAGPARYEALSEVSLGG